MHFFPPSPQAIFWISRGHVDASKCRLFPPPVHACISIALRLLSAFPLLSGFHRTLLRLSLMGPETRNITGNPRYYYCATHPTMWSVVLKKTGGRESEELSKTKARQYHRTNQNRCDAHEDYHTQHPCISSTKNRPLSSLNTP